MKMWGELNSWKPVSLALLATQATSLRKIAGWKNFYGNNESEGNYAF